MNNYLAWSGAVWLIFGILNIVCLKQWYPFKIINILIALIGGAIITTLLK